MKLKIFDVRVQEDYGRDIYLTFLKLNRWCLVQSSFSSFQYPTKFPYFSIILGSGRLLGISFQWITVGFTVEFFSRSWFSKRY